MKEVQKYRYLLAPTGLLLIATMVVAFAVRNMSDGLRLKLHLAVIVLSVVFWLEIWFLTRALRGLLTIAVLLIVSAAALGVFEILESPLLLSDATRWLIAILVIVGFLWGRHERREFYKNKTKKSSTQ
jgi:hypothetical protein